ncbi:MAG TPA: hypothetical protein VJ692_13815 [Nitrospiraceae bacterium]|nr:hypothetical protein [Nitrospiraceae bacterium]
MGSTTDLLYGGLRRSLILGAVLLGGCTLPIQGQGNTTHHLIVGVGVCSVNDPKDKAVVTTDTHALGLSVSDRPGLKFGLGYSSSTVVTVGDGAEDVRIEVSKTLGGPLIVDTQSAILKHPAATTGGSHDQRTK